jgi:hypothetical protein
MSAHRNAALASAACGWFVFQARYKLLKNGKWNKQGRWSGKKANGLNWAMTKDPIEIQKLWVSYPDDPLGIPTGSVNGFFVLDVDTATANGHKHDGFAALQALENKHGPLPPTLMAQSPTGSAHYYFRLPPGMRIKNSASEIMIEGDTRALGIDVRGEGGMVIAPPSKHPRGGKYRWLNDLDVADAPQWLIEIVPKSNDVRKKSVVARLRAPAKPMVASILDPVLAAMMEADAGKGLSTDPADYFPDDPDTELKIRSRCPLFPATTTRFGIASAAPSTTRSATRAMPCSMSGPGSRRSMSRASARASGGNAQRCARSERGRSSGTRISTTAAGARYIGGCSAARWRYDKAINRRAKGDEAGRRRKASTG